MYNFSGIIHRIWWMCGVWFLLGAACILIEKPWRKDFKLKKCRIGFISIALAVCMSIVYISRIISPAVSSYTGEFVRTRRKSGGAQPLPFTFEYTFEHEDGGREIFYLDIFSKKEIFPYDFEKTLKYTIYYDELTRVITKVEVVE